jgi:hypothetical protein
MVTASLAHAGLKASSVGPRQAKLDLIIAGVEAVQQSVIVESIRVYRQLVFSSADTGKYKPSGLVGALRAIRKILDLGILYSGGHGHHCFCHPDSMFIADPA